MRGGTSATRKLAQAYLSAQRRVRNDDGNVGCVAETMPQRTHRSHPLKLPGRDGGVGAGASKAWSEVVAAAAPRRPSVFRIPVSANRAEFESQTSELGAGKRSR